ncbi:MAG: hypothetical protein J6W84_07185 [Bacteroidales bacterium]|nr:hypothetical protein [Bacteroidales bacterium]
MSEEKFMNKYRIASTRAQWHDYNGGKYFVTICTHGREHYFGEISGGQMNLSEIGKYTNTVIQTTSTHNHYAEIPLYVIMPNHLHLIVVIDDENGENVPWCENDGTVSWCENDGIVPLCGNGGDVPWRENCGTVPGKKYCRDVPWRVSANGKNTTMQDICNRQGKLSTVIGGMKQSVTRFARKHNIPFAWQTRFHDHIIRDTNEMNRIAKYIENNVAKWEYKHIN